MKGDGLGGRASGGGITGQAPDRTGPPRGAELRGERADTPVPWVSSALPRVQQTSRILVHPEIRQPYPATDDPQREESAWTSD